MGKWGSGSSQFDPIQCNFRVGGRAVAYFLCLGEFITFLEGSTVESNKLRLCVSATYGDDAMDPALMCELPEEDFTNMPNQPYIVGS